MKRGPRTLKFVLVAVAVASTLAFVLIATTATARSSDGRPCGGYWGAEPPGDEGQRPDRWLPCWVAASSCL